MVYNVIRWPDEKQGGWWFVAESGTDGSYTPLMPLYPRWNQKRELPPTYENQLWLAAELLVQKGIESLSNPHAMIGRDCKCGSCFCCAALEVYKIAKDVEVTQ